MRQSPEPGNMAGKSSSRGRETSAAIIFISQVGSPCTYILLTAGIISAQVIHTTGMYIPFFQDAPGIAPVSLHEWIAIIALSSSVLVVMEIYKFLMNRREIRTETP